MPASLALVLCTVFVLALLVIERRQSSAVASAIWIPTLWMLWIASKPLATWYGTGSDDEGSLLDQILGAALFILGVLIVAGRRTGRVAPALRANGWLVLLLAYSLLSVLWADVPLIALKRWLRELVALAMALAVLSEADPVAAMQSLLRRTTFILIPYSVLLIKYFPTYGIQYRQQGGEMWIGVALQKNSLGRLCVIAVFFLVWLLVRRWKGREIPVGRFQTLADVMVLLLALLLLYGPGDQYSATAVASLAAGLLVFVGLTCARTRPLGFKLITLLVLATIAVGTSQPFLGGAAVSGMSSELGRNATLTGRTEIWEGLVPEVMREPLLGSGFASFWNPDTRYRHQIGEAHNGYLEVLLDRGFLGILLLVMFLLSSSRRAQRLLPTDQDWASLWICFLVIALVHNITESSINTFTSELTAILLFLAIVSPAPAPRIVSRPALRRASPGLP